MDDKVFTYEEASEALEAVREVTEAAHRRLQELREKIENSPPGSAKVKKLNEWINTVINQWAEDIMGLGGLPKGLWTVDFDSGKGFYYCWTLNESTLSYFHHYQEGFMGRKPLAEIEDAPPPMLLN
ncbi:MAG: DUF2203 family protein [SAR324 cluster bacterium]|nr:DUF2203 family protein [SAR324 cluster bacterium]